MPIGSEPALGGCLRQLPGLPRRLTIVPLVFVGVVLIGRVAAVYVILPADSDWRDAYRPAVLNLLAGQSPCGLSTTRLFLNGPWILILLIPLAVSPPQLDLGMAAIFWLVEAWCSGGWRDLSTEPDLEYRPVDAVDSGGLILMASAQNSRAKRPAIMASPFLSPCLAAHSWAVVLLGLLPGTLSVITGSAGIWITWLLGGGPKYR